MIRISSEIGHGAMWLYCTVTLPQQPLMDRCTNQPDTEARRQNRRKRKMFREADVDGNKKQDTGDNSPQGSLCEGRH